MELLARLFEQHFHVPAAMVRLQPLQGELGASGRKLIRLAAEGATAIGVLYGVREENRAFVEFSRHFRRHGLPVPEIFAEDLEHGAYLEEDLGDATLFEYLSQHRSGEHIGPEVVEAYRRAVEFLPKFQIDAGRDLNYKFCHPRADFDRQSIAWDLNYFKYYFLRLAGVAFNEQALEDDFGRLTRFLLSAPRDFFLYRDFQSRNIMLRAGQPWFLDYQGGRRGALQYDIASLLYDAKADLPPEVRQLVLDHYLEELGRHCDVSRAEFMQHYYSYVYVRIMQAMGTYGYRGFFQRKTLFLQSVPYALQNLRWLLHHAEIPIALPALTGAFRSLLGAEKLQALGTEPARLTVRVFSFSYHREHPADSSGNGGGFVFDARCLPNPGREEQFKSLTGRDTAVAEYLRAQASVQQYLAAATALVGTSVSEYRQRGFKHLMVSFGCTGGQHRSVYLAEEMARHLREQLGVEVELRHCELEKMGR